MKTCCKAVRALILCFAFFMLAGNSINAHAAEDNDTTITVNVDSLRVRQNPSLKAKRLGHVNNGSILHYIDTVDDEWIAVEFNGETAYVAARYVTINCMGPAEEQGSQQVAEEPEVQQISEEPVAEEQIAVLQDAENGTVEIQTAGEAVVTQNTEEAVAETVEIQNTEETVTEAAATEVTEAEVAAVAELSLNAETTDVQVSETTTPGFQQVTESTEESADDSACDSADGGSDEEIILEEEAVPLAAEIVEDSYEVKLLAALIQCEAGGECYEGQVAVGAVVMNRVADPRFPETIAEVIYQPGQFTPVKRGKVDRVLTSGNISESCLQAAREAVSGVSNVGTATRFRRGTREGGIVIQHHVFFSV